MKQFYAIGVMMLTDSVKNFLIIPFQSMKIYLIVDFSGLWK